MSVKFGLKLWSTNSNLLKEAKKLIEDDIFQYIELTPIPNTEITPFLEVSVPYIIHITTEKNGLNIANKRQRRVNFELISTCTEWADKLNAKYLILHPGFGSIEDAIGFLSNIDDSRILIENMPRVGLNKESMIGYTPEQIKRLRVDKFGFCLDLNHAIKASISLHKQYKEFIGKFLDWHPKMFHISDGTFDNEKDEHLNIGDGDYDFKFLKECVMKNESKYVTSETPKENKYSLEGDLKNLDKLREIWNYRVP